MELTTRLKKRFCKDTDLPINLYHEPYFTERIHLFNDLFDSVEKLETFKKDLSNFKNEEEYFEYYNKVKDNFINNLKAKKEYEEFLTCNMNKFSVPDYKVGGKSVFTETNIGKRLISIDLKQANFHAMKFFNRNLVDNKDTYEELIGQFTPLKHIIKSKYIRQVVFGNCNPKRQVTIEKFMMHFVMEILLKYMDTKHILTYMSDEIVFEYFDGVDLESIYKELDQLQKEKGFLLHCEDYVLHKIENTEFYMKKFVDGSVEFKCVNHLFYPFVARAYKGEEVQENDKVFYHEGYLSKFIEVPEIKIV